MKSGIKMKEDYINKEVYLQCDCGAHIMKVNCSLEFMGDNQLYHQEWNFAMFNYAGLGNPSFWDRIKTVWKYLWGGKIHNDQIIINPSEAHKLVQFIEQNNFGKCINNNNNV